MDAAPPPQAPQPTDRRTLARIVVVAVFASVVLWSSRTAILDAAAGALVHEDPIEAADLIVVSQANGAGDALEAADLYLGGFAPLVVVPRWIPRPYERQIRDLGVAYPAAHELARDVLVRKGVPSGAIVVLDESVEGLTSETAAVADYVRAEAAKTIVFVTVRSHSARAAYLLHKHLGTAARVLVTSPRQDTFPAPEWWRHRDQAREVVTEYIRWAAALGGTVHDSGSEG